MAGRSAAPAYPDLRERVAELEASLAGMADRATAAQRERTELQARADERNGAAPAPKVIEEPAEAAVTRKIIRQQEEEDPALAAYNRYLARLNSESHRRD